METIEKVDAKDIKGLFAILGEMSEAVEDAYYAVHPYRRIGVRLEGRNIVIEDKIFNAGGELASSVKKIVSFD